MGAKHIWCRRHLLCRTVRCAGLTGLTSKVEQLSIGFEDTGRLGRRDGRDRCWNTLGSLAQVRGLQLLFIGTRPKEWSYRKGRGRGNSWAECWSHWCWGWSWSWNSCYRGEQRSPLPTQNRHEDRLIDCQLRWMRCRERSSWLLSSKKRKLICTKVATCREVWEG